MGDLIAGDTAQLAEGRGVFQLANQGIGEVHVQEIVEQVGAPRGSQGPRWAFRMAKFSQSLQESIVVQGEQ